MVRGDFNVIIGEDEKLGGFPFTQTEATDYAQSFNNCELVEAKNKYTWWNVRIEGGYIFKRLGRILLNRDLMDISLHLKFIRQVSDHAPLHLVCNTKKNMLSSLLVS